VNGDCDIGSLGPLVLLKPPAEPFDSGEAAVEVGVLLLKGLENGGWPSALLEAVVDVVLEGFDRGAFLLGDGLVVGLDGVSERLEVRELVGVAIEESCGAEALSIGSFGVGADVQPSCDGPNWGLEAMKPDQFLKFLHVGKPRSHCYLQREC